ncbi:MAG: alpha/beta hydrolase [Pseudomonadota bacterium]
MKHIVDSHVLINNQRIATGVHKAADESESVVLLHGTPSSSLIWRNVVPTLNAAGYTVHVFDLLGYGLSERPRNPAVDTSISAQVPILEHLFDHWELDSAHVVGHDFGGAIAKRFSLASPTKVRSLALIDSVSFDSYPSKRTREQMQAGLDSLIQKPDAEHRAHFREWLLSSVFNKQRLATTVLDTYVEMISGTVGQGSLFQHQIRHYDPKHTMEIADRLHELASLPVKIIWGANDEWQVVDWAHKLHTAIPRSELEVIDRCGHFAMEDQPEKVSDRLLEFFARAG